MTFLKPTVKSLPNTDVTLYLGNDMNVAFKIETPKGSSMMYYIAPRVEKAVLIMKNIFELRDDFCKDCQEPRCGSCHTLEFVKSISKKVTINKEN